MHSAWWLGSGLLMRMPLVNEYSLQTLRNNTLLLQCKCGRSKTPRICLTQECSYWIESYWSYSYLLLALNLGHALCSRLALHPTLRTGPTHVSVLQSFFLTNFIYLSIYIRVRLSNRFCAFRRRFLNIVSSVSLQVPTSENYSVPSIYSIFHYLLACVQVALKALFWIRPFKPWSLSLGRCLLCGGQNHLL